MKTTGRVTEVFTRPWQGRQGQIILYSFKIEGDTRFYRTGEQNLAVVNDIVEFEFDQKGNATNFVSKGQASTPPPAVQQAITQAQGASYARPAGGGFKQKQAEKDAYWNDKEQRDIARERRQHEVVEPRITWSSAQSDAVAVVTAALQHDLLSFGNANKSARLGLLLDYVDQVTTRFALQRWAAHDKLAEALANIEGKELASEPSLDAPKNWEA